MQDLGLKNGIVKQDNEKASYSRKWSPRAATVKNLEDKQASDPIIFDLVL